MLQTDCASGTIKSTVLNDDLLAKTNVTCTNDEHLDYDQRGFCTDICIVI